MNTRIALTSKIAAAGLAVAMIAAPATALASHDSKAQPAAAPAATSLQAPLTGSAAHPGATGLAKYKARSDERELQIEVQRIRALAGRSVVFFARGTRVGTSKVSATGTAQINRNTELGQSVPTIVHGSPVSVRTATGTLIASGRF
jgi:hypothetical protein